MTTGVIVGAMASGGVLLEASTPLDLCFGIASVVKSGDDVKNLVTGKAENGKDYVAITKKGISFTGAVKGLFEISKTVSSPFQIISFTMDIISTAINSVSKEADIVHDNESENNLTRK